MADVVVTSLDASELLCSALKRQEAAFSQADHDELVPAIPPATSHSPISSPSLRLLSSLSFNCPLPCGPVPISVLLCPSPKRQKFLDPVTPRQILTRKQREKEAYRSQRRLSRAAEQAAAGTSLKAIVRRHVAAAEALVTAAPGISPRNAWCGRKQACMPRVCSSRDVFAASGLRLIEWDGRCVSSTNLLFNY